MTGPLEVVTVSCGYGDYLSETAKFNCNLFDRWIIVTTPDDVETREVARKFSLEVLLTEEGHADGGFNKGWMIERGLRLVSARGTRLHLDADIVLPSRFRQLVEAADVQPDCLYGWDRVMVKGWDQWQRLLKSGYLTAQHSYHNYVKFPAGYEVGTRWADAASGFAVLGHGQLWSSENDFYRGVRIRGYPDRHNDACRSDIQFSHLWDRRKRVLIPEVIAVHLESEDAPNGANWKGRKTKRFGPPMGVTGDAAVSAS